MTSRGDNIRKVVFPKTSGQSRIQTGGISEKLAAVRRSEIAAR
jgi:hypothetical protein